MYQVGTYLPWQLLYVYIVESFDVGSNSLYLTLPHRPTRYLYPGGRRGEAKRKRFYVRNDGWIFFFFRDQMR